MGRIAAAAILVCVLAASCGQGGPGDDDLSMVPANSICYIRASADAAGLVSALLPRETGVVPAALLEDLLAAGPLGAAVISVDFTDLRPQLLFLTRGVDPGEMERMAASRLDCRTEESRGRTDLLTGRGAILGSVASRDGWTCLYLGRAPTSVVGPWLEMEESGSLAADTGLAALEGGEAQLSLLLPGNMIDFLGLLPLQRWYPGLADLRSSFMSLRPRALRVDLSTGPTISLEARMLRQGGRRTRLSLELEDPGLSADSLPSIIRTMAEELL
jgi:hypothetical protein